MHVSHSYMHLLCRKLAGAVARSTGCKSSYSFMRFPNHNRLLQCYPDAMHTIKDVIERTFFLLIGKANTQKIELAEASIGRFGFKKSSRKRKREESAQHPYVLSKADLKLADLRSKTITAPNCDFHPGSVFFRTTSLKSHDWKEVIVLSTNEYSLIYVHLACSKKYFEILLTWNAPCSPTNHTVSIL